MFSFKSALKKPSPPCSVHHYRARQQVPVILLSLFTIFLFVSCNADTGGSSGFILEGKWVSPYDSYTITKTAVDYFMDNSSFVFPDAILKGAIKETVSFSDNAGVLIIQVTESKTIGNTVGYFTGVYYRDGTKTSVQMANAINADYRPVETVTLSEAQSAFTAGNMGAHVSYWGSYTK
jgi:hypothetical protein